MDVYMFGLLSKGSLVSMAGIDFGSQTIKGRHHQADVPAKVHPSVSVAEIPMPRGTLVDYQLQDIERVSRSPAQSLAQAARARVARTWPRP